MTSGGFLVVLLFSLVALGGTTTRYGCRFNRQICSRNERCLNDGFLGECRRLALPASNYGYKFDQHTFSSLERKLRDVINSNLNLKCVVTGLIEAYQYGRTFDTRLCLNTPDDNENDRLIKDDLDLLATLYDGGSTRDIDKVLTSLDEKSSYQSDYKPVRLERFSESVAEDEPFEKHPQKDEIANLYSKIYKSFPPSDGEGEARGSWLDSQKSLDTLSERDMQLLRKFIERLTKEDDYSQTKSDGDTVGIFGKFDLEMTPDDAVPVSVSTQEKGNEMTEMQSGLVQDENTQLVKGVSPPRKLPTVDHAQPMMSQEDAKILGDLLAGRLDVQDVPSDRLDKLSLYVTAMLNAMKSKSTNEDNAQQRTSDHKESQPKPYVPTHRERMGNEAFMNHRANAKTYVQYPAMHSNLRTQKKTSYHGVGDSYTGPEVRTHSDSEIISKKHNIVDTRYAYIKTTKNVATATLLGILRELERALGPQFENSAFTNLSFSSSEVSFLVKAPLSAKTASLKAEENDFKKKIQKLYGVGIEAGLGVGKNKVATNVLKNARSPPSKYFVIAFVLCGCIAGLLVGVVAIFIIKKHLRRKEKLKHIGEGKDDTKACSDYQDLCRQRMQSKSSEKPEPLHIAQTSHVIHDAQQGSPARSSRSSTSSWSEEPVASNMDISTGHAVLSYMENHLKEKDRLDREWTALCAYEAELSTTDGATMPENARKNRYPGVVPYDHSRVVLNEPTNVAKADYINASTITDHDPRNPAYITTQGPLPHTVADFWQMVWEQGSYVIVSLTQLTENGVAMCHRFWPTEGSELYHIYEVHLVSEHIWCDDYLVRSFYLKNLNTNETRTVTQFHFQTWKNSGVPASIRALLDFRRKVNKSYRGKSCPIVVHCSDGAGRSGTYCLIDMVLNRMAKGAKEIDIAATLEHIRDQRMAMVQTKEQFEFALACVAEEVHMILKALPQ